MGYISRAEFACLCWNFPCVRFRPRQGKILSVVVNCDLPHGGILGSESHVPCLQYSGRWNLIYKPWWLCLDINP